MKNLFLLILITLITNSVIAQIAINTDGAIPDSTAILDLQSNDKGLLVPRMTQNEIRYIINPANGLLIFNTTEDKFYAYASSLNSWREIPYGLGAFLPWTCGDDLLYEGQDYPTKLFGSQCWITDNMNVGVAINGNLDQTDNGILEKYCFLNNSNLCASYGGLYQWNELMQYALTEGSQGICPASWHVASDGEYKTLEILQGLTQAEADATGYRGTNEGSIIASVDTNIAGQLHWIVGNLTNDPQFGESEFNILPGGKRTPTGLFHSSRFNAYIWTSTRETTGSNITYRGMIYNRTDIFRDEMIDQGEGYSVKCIKD